MGTQPGKSEPGHAGRLEIGKAVIGCVSAILVACISGAIAIVTNWDTVQKFLGSFTSSPILFQDEFSNTSSGWDQYTDDATGNITDYADGNYRIFVNEPEIDLISNPGKSFSDVVIKVTAQFHGGPEDNLFGVMCRYQDVDNYYELVISTDGYYGIGKSINGEFSWLGGDDMQPSDEIHTGGLTNLIQGECVKDRLTLYANGHKLMEVHDKDILQPGDIGLMAGSSEEPGVDIYFDHLIVRKP